MEGEGTGSLSGFRSGTGKRSSRWRGSESACLVLLSVLNGNGARSQFICVFPRDSFAIVRLHFNWRGLAGTVGPASPDS